MAQEIDYSKLSDEELEKLAGAPAQQDVSQMSEEQLTQLANAPQQQQQQQQPQVEQLSETVEIPPLVAGGATAAMLGVPAMEAAGTIGAASLAKDFLTSPQGKQLGQRLKQMVVKAPPPMPTPAEKWNVAMHGVKLPNAEMDQKHFDIGQGMKNAIGPGGELQGGSIRGGVMLNEADTKALQQREAQAAAQARDQALMQEARRRMQANKSAAALAPIPETPSMQQSLLSKLKGKAATTALAYPSTFGVGYNAADMYNRLQQDNVPQAAIAGAGMVGSGASMIPKKGIRKAGIITAIGAPLLNAGIDYIQGRAEGGSIQHYSDGNSVKLKGKAGAAQAIGGGLVSLAKKFGYDAEKVAKEYPEVIPPVLAVDPKKGTEYLAKQLSPEALAVQKARKAAQMEIEKGQHSPFFKLEERYHVDPKNYPLEQRTLEVTMPKKAETAVSHRAKATSPEAIQRLEAAYERGAAHPGAHDFYAMGQLEDSFVKELGPEAGRAAFKSRFADPLAATTGGADPNSNLMTAAYTNFMREKGLPFPEATHQLPFPIGGRFIAGNIEQANKYRDLGALDPVSNPKRYNFSSNFQGHLDRPTIDEQMMNLFDPKGPKAPPWYGVQEGVVNDLAAKRGVTPVNYQEVAWAGGKNYEGKPMMQEINEMLHRTSRITGQPQEEVLKGFIHGNKPMYGIGAGAIGAGGAMDESNQNYAAGGEVQHMADGKLTGYLSTLEQMAQNAQDKAHRSWRETASMTPQEMAQTGWEAAKFAGSFNPLISAGLVGSQFIDAAKGNTGWGEALGNAALNAPGVVGKAAKAAAPYVRQALPYVGGLGALGMADAAEAAPKPSVMKGMMDDVMQGFAPKVAKEITPGAPHTYGPQATGSWVRDYQQAHPVNAAGLPTTREGWDALHEQGRMAQIRAEQELGRTGPNRPSGIQYMGKFRRGTPEERAAQRQSDIDTIRMLQKLRGLD